MWELQRETFTAIPGTGGSRGALLVWVLLVVNKMEKQGRQVLLNCCFQDAQRLGGTVTRQVDEVLTRYCP